MRDLTEHATQREFVYSHAWRPHDLVMWDNRATMHRARRFDRNEVRDVRRTTLAGDMPTVAQGLSGEKRKARSVMAPRSKRIVCDRIVSSDVRGQGT